MYSSFESGILKERLDDRYETALGISLNQGSIMHAVHDMTRKLFYSMKWRRRRRRRKSASQSKNNGNIFLRGFFLPFMKQRQKRAKRRKEEEEAEDGPRRQRKSLCATACPRALSSTLMCCERMTQ